MSPAHCFLPSRLVRNLWPCGVDPEWRWEWFSVIRAWYEDGGSYGTVEGFVRLRSSLPRDVGPLVAPRGPESVNLDSPWNIFAGFNATLSDNSGSDGTLTRVLVATMVERYLGLSC